MELRALDGEGSPCYQHIVPLRVLEGGEAALQTKQQKGATMVDNPPAPLPVAVADTSARTRHDLRTLEGAWIETRKYTYEERSRRAGVAYAMTFGRGRDSDAKIEDMQHDANVYDIQHCVTDHNLGDANGLRLDLTNPKVISGLSPIVGEEINAIIDRENKIDEETLKLISGE